MLTMLGSPRRCCDGITRRETLRAGTLTALGGLSLADVLHADEARRAAAEAGRGDFFHTPKAKNVIMVFLLGGAATQDMYDLKPKAPPEVRGEFKPIATNVPGIDVCEHLPKLAKWMHKIAVIRSITHKAGCHNCLPCYTGYELPPPDQHPRDTDPPSMGSVFEWLKDPRQDMPAYVYMPCWLGWGQAFRRAGPYGGFLGKRFDGLTTECMPYMDAGQTPSPGNPSPVRGAPILPNSSFGPDMTIDRFQARRGLLAQIDEQLQKVETRDLAGYNRQQQQAFSLLTSSKLKEAFDLSKEDPKLVDRYGQTLFGNSTLIARRLIETGVRFVNVTWDLFWDRIKIDYDAWDTHVKNFSILKQNKLPGFDQTFTALLEDLETRGLLDETLVVVTSEMGRTPRVNGNAGRDHWTFCYGSMLAGAGVRGGTVYGASNAQAAYVQSNPVAPSDLCATIYRCLGIDPHMPVYDRLNRPVAAAQGGHVIDDVLT